MGDQADRPSGLILIKHGMPLIVPGQPPSGWELAPEGREQALRLAERLVDLAPDRFVSSLEPKAIQTAEALATRLGRPCGRDACLGEQLNDAGPFTDQQTFQASVARMFAHPRELVMGEETADQAYERFDAALSRQQDAHRGERLAIVGHGRVISLWISRRFGVDPMPLWLCLRLGSALAVGEGGFRQIDA